jgi:hypothetical protein
MKIRDRIKSLRRVKASELLPHPKNWRTHPEAQQNAMRGVLAEIGWADAALVRETPEGLQFIDGHLRGDVAGDTKIPVLVLDVTEAEAEKILATHDPLASMAGADPQVLGELMANLETGSKALQEMLHGLAAEHGIDLSEPGAGDLVDPEPQIDRAAELQKEWGTELGQLWEIPGQAGVHRMLCGDAGNEDYAEQVLDGALAQLIATSPPYN